MRYSSFAATALALGLLAAQSAPAEGQAIPGSNRARASNAAKAGRYSEAKGAYRAMLATAAPEDSSLRAEALFGEAFASQQLLRPDSADGTDSREVVDGYLKARALDSTRLFASASNNAAILLREQGDHAKALKLFLDAATATTANRPLFLLNAAREFEALQQADSASALYRQALAADAGYGEAGIGLLNGYWQSGKVDSLVALVTRWHGPSVIGLVNDAILGILQDRERSLDSIRGRELLIVFGRNVADQQPDPSYFSKAVAPRLLAARERRPFLGDGPKNLIEAYQPRKPGSRYSEPGNAWWKRQYSLRGTYNEMARTGWTAVLRGLGDRYFQAKDLDVAASYYEAALGFPANSMPGPEADLSALMPLGIIYVTRAKGGDREAVANLNVYVRWLFDGKGRAYSTQDLRRVRGFHIALGELFAQQKIWGTPGDPRGAIFQLEHMRMVTQRITMADPSHPLFDPPELLEHLADAYEATGNRALARGAAVEARDGYLKAGLNTEADRLTQRINQLSGPP